MILYVTRVALSATDNHETATIARWFERSGRVFKAVGACEHETRKRYLPIG